MHKRTHTYTQMHACTYAETCKCQFESLKLCIQAVKEHIQMNAYWQNQNGSLLHSNTLRKCKTTLPISGKLRRAVDFWRGSGTSVSASYLMPLLPAPQTVHSPAHTLGSAPCLLNFKLDIVHEEDMYILYLGEHESPEKDTNHFERICHPCFYFHNRRFKLHNDNFNILKFKQLNHSLRGLLRFTLPRHLFCL